MFRAYQPERDRLVAVKVFRLDLPPEKVHQFVAELEALIAADLTHPGIAAPLSAGLTDTSAYLVQDFVAADSLDIVIRDFGPAPAPDALRVATQLAGALDFAAAVNVKHGALHPRDLLVSPDDARLTGMGITAALDKVGVTAPIRRPYTAPERAAAAPWDRRADVFSLAALVFELLWGRRVGGSGAQAVASVSDLPLGDPVELRRVFARALADDPRDRFDTALSFAEALAVACSVLPSPPSRGEPRRDWSEFEARSGAPRSILPGRVGDPPVDDSPVDNLIAPVGSEPLLPLDEPVVLPLEEAGVVPPAPPISVGDLELRTAEASRYEDVESAPTFAVDDAEDVAPALPTTVPVPVDDVRPVPDRVSAPLPLHAAAVTAASSSALERSRSAVWPILLALIVGGVIGFALGVSTRSAAEIRTAAAEPPVQQRPAPAAPVREFTEDAVAAAQKPAAGSAAGVPGTPAPPAEAAVAAPQRAVPSAPPPARTNSPSARAASPPAAAAANAGRLLVRSTPAGARVLIDGRDVGATPLTQYELAHGSHTVRVTHEGYFTAERRVSVSAAQPAQSLTIELRPATAEPPLPTPGTSGRFAGALMIDSRPVGASVYLDGKQVGTTPVLLDSLNAGEHAVRLELTGYRRWTSSVRVVAGDRTRVTASLEK